MGAPGTLPDFRCGPFVGAPLSVPACGCGAFVGSPCPLPTCTCGCGLLDRNNLALFRGDGVGIWEEEDEDEPDELEELDDDRLRAVAEICTDSTSRSGGGVGSALALGKEEGVAGNLDDLLVLRPRRPEGGEEKGSPDMACKNCVVPRCRSGASGDS